MSTQVIFDTAEWDSFFHKIAVTMKDPQPILTLAFTTRGFRDVISHFDDANGSKGAWAPLKPSTIARRRKGKGSGSAQPLQDTGNLRRNFLPGNIEDKGQNAVVFFNPTPYAAVHDEGSPGRNIPQREFMWLSDDAMDDMTKIILEFVVKW